jgi:YVTN family beta-propeller protein
MGRALSDLAVTPDGRFLLAVDEADHQLLVVSVSGSDLAVRGRIQVPAYPVRVAISANGRTAFVSSLWSRRVSLIDLEDGVPETLTARLTRTIDLPFNPRHLLSLDESDKLLAADAFGGSLAVIDTRRGALESVRSLKAHNIGGLVRAPEGGRVYLTHQTLHRTARTTSDDIHWGFLVTNMLRDLSLASVLDPKADLMRDGRLASYGRPGDGGGDPAGLVVTPNGTTVTALAGVHLVAVGTLTYPDGPQIPVGRRPTAVAPAPDGRHAFVASTFDDTVSVLDLESVERVATIGLGAKPPLGPVAVGEQLFHDARLSQEGWMSCHSCHSDGHSNHLVADTLGDETYGAPKRVPSLLGVDGTAPFGWQGNLPTLEDQVRKSIRTTMRGRDLGDEQIQALTAYLNALEPPPSPSTLTGRIDPAAVGRGRDVFERRCKNCHPAPNHTTSRTYRVGLRDEQGETLFNPPSLRGVSQRDALLHDGTARSVRAVLNEIGHPAPDARLSPAELDDVLAFLETL